jgi:hypothetical protein
MDPLLRPHREVQGLERQGLAAVKLLQDLEDLRGPGHRLDVVAEPPGVLHAADAPTAPAAVSCLGYLSAMSARTPSMTDAGISGSMTKKPSRSNWSRSCCVRIIVCLSQPGFLSVGPGIAPSESPDRRRPARSGTGLRGGHNKNLSP